MLLFGLLLSAALASFVQPSTAPSQMPSTSPSTGPSTSPSIAPTSTLPSDFAEFEGVGWCQSSLDTEMWDGQVSDLGSKTPSECWNACQSAHPDIAEPLHEFWNDGEETRCYCQDGCPCMADAGESSTLAPPGWSPTDECDNTCAELDDKYPECDDEYQGVTECDPSQEDLDYYEEHCEDSSDSEEDDSNSSSSEDDSSDSSSEEEDGPEVDCDVCVAQFAEAGGCECMSDESCDETTLILDACDPCGDEAATYCDITVTEATYTVESRLEMSGVTSSNFESKKSALKTVIAGFFDVAESKVSLAFDGRRMLENTKFGHWRRMLSTGEIVVTIATTDSTEAYAVRDTMETPTFTTSLTTEITTQSSTFTELSGVSVTSATAPIISAPTTTTTTTTTATTTTSMEGSATALMSFVAIIASALLF